MIPYPDRCDLYFGRPELCKASGRPGIEATYFQPTQQGTVSFSTFKLKTETFWDDLSEVLTGDFGLTHHLSLIHFPILGTLADVYKSHTIY
jgi:hypothetical protein